MAWLILVRHGKSEWNAKGLWTGWTDVPLNEEGKEEGRKAGEALRDIEIHHAYVSNLMRAKETLDEIKKVIQNDLEPIAHEALNERHYGVYTGKNKWEVKEEVGEETFQSIRRGWDTPIPEGESLKQVHARAVPYYESEILPKLKTGKNVILVAHGNTLRAIIKHLEELSDLAVQELEVGTGEIYCYDLDPQGKVIRKEIRSSNPNKGKV